MNKIIQHLTIIVFFILVVFIINKIPDGYIISGGDFNQLLNINENITRNLYTWFENSGQGQFNPLITTYPFYFIQQFLFNLGFSYSQISNFIIFQFLILSFYTFYFAQKLIFKDLKYKFIGPFSYSLNTTVIAILFYPWIITHHFLIYIFIPILLGTFINWFLSGKVFNKDLILFLLIFIFSLPAYNNIAFLFALFFIQGLFFAIYSIITIKNKNIFKKNGKFILSILLQIIVSLIVILPFLSSQYGYKDTVIKTKAFAGNAISSIMSNTSSTPFNSFRLIIDNWRFPNINLDTKFQQIPSIYIVLSSLFSFLFILIIIYGLTIKEEKSIGNKIFYTFLLSYIVLLFLSFRLTSPFDTINLFFYKTLTLGLFRSPDKIFVFIPFFTIVLFLYSLQKMNLGKKGIFIIYLSLFLSVSFLFTGGIVKQYLYNTNGYNQGLVKIPQEYYDIQKIINKDEKNNSILSIPYSIINSLNWSNYAKWGYIGHDLLHLLYNKNYISANTYDHPVLETELSLKRFSDSNENINELIKIIQKFGGRYILDHKDIEERFLGLTKDSLIKLENSNIIKPIISNDYFDLYEVNKSYINSLINGINLSFQKINPIKYRIHLNINGNNNLNFLQSHNPQWKLYLKPNQNTSWCNPIETYNNDGKNIIECEHKQEFFQGEELSYLYKKPLFENTHHLVYDYANGWTISKDEIIKYVNENYSKELQKEGYPKQLSSGKLDYKYYTLNSDGSIDVELILYFKPQSYFYLGLIISGSAFIVLVGYLGYDMVRSRRKKEDKNQTE